MVCVSYPRQACSYLDPDEVLAKSFVDAWRARVDVAEVDLAAIALFLTNERLKIWEYFTRPAHRADWRRVTTFAAFVAR